MTEPPPLPDGAARMSVTAQGLADDVERILNGEDTATPAPIRLSAQLQAAAVRHSLRMRHTMSPDACEVYLTVESALRLASLLGASAPTEGTVAQDLMCALASHDVHLPFLSPQPVTLRPDAEAAPGLYTCLVDNQAQLLADAVEAATAGP